MMTLAAGASTAAGLIRSTTRVGRRGGPSLMISSTSPCETLAACLRRYVDGRAAGIAAGYLADLVLADPRRGHPVALFGLGAAGLERFTYSDDRLAGVFHTGALLGALAVAGIAGERAAARRGPGVDGSGHGGDDVRRARWHVADAHRCTDGGPAGPRRHRRRPGTAAVAVRTRPGRTGFRRAYPRGGGVGRREHVRRAGCSAAVRRNRRRARAAGLPRCQHARRDDRPPITALPPIRLGRSAVRRSRSTIVAARVTGVLVAICAPVVGGSPSSALRGLAPRRRSAPQPQRRRRRSGIRGCAGRPARRAHAVRPPAGDPARPSATGPRRRSTTSFGRCGCRGPCNWSARSLATAVVSVACRSGRRASLRW